MPLSQTERDIAKTYYLHEQESLANAKVNA